MSTASSRVAFQQDRDTQIERVYRIIEDSMPYGIINDDIAARYLALHGVEIREGAISGCITHLRWQKRVMDSGARRDGKVASQNVWVLGDDRDVVEYQREERINATWTDPLTGKRCFKYSAEALLNALIRREAEGKLDPA